MELQAPAFKLASFEATDLPLIRKAAMSGKPLIVSTGMADLGEIAEAVAAARSVPAAGLILLHCVSGYPTPPHEANLRTIPNLAETFDVMVGLSDHTLDNAAAVASVALGACVIEKHFTLRRADGGPDAGFSLEPDELAQLVRGVRTAWEALGSIDYGRKPSEALSAPFRRSLFAVRDIAAGAALTAENIRSIRPGYGLPPKHLPELIGRRAARDLRRGEALDWTMIA
jgi:N-acetylneuraminate synthase